MSHLPASRAPLASDTVDRIASGLVESAAAAPWLAAVRDAYVDGIVMVDAAGEFVYFNQAANEILGFGPTPTNSAEWTRQYGLYESDGITPVAEENLPLVCALRGEIVRERVLFVRNAKQPAGVWIHVVAMPLGEEGQPIVGAVAVMRQMTDWYARMNKLVAMEARFLAFLHSSQDAVLLADPKGRIENWNDGAERLFGLTAEELSQRYIEDLLEVPTLDEQTEHQLTTIRMQGIHTDGSRFPADVSLAPSRTPQGLVYTFMIRDVTGEELLKAQLLQAQKMEAIGTLAAGVAHEINTPTQYVNDNVHFLHSAYGDLQPVFERVGRLVQMVKGGAAPDAASLQALASSWSAADPDFLLTEIPMAINQSQQGLSRIAEIVRSMKALSHPGQEQDFVAEDLNDVIQQAVTVSTGEWK